jgi:nucleoside-diphosphate-sugar epimerase
MILVTGATGFVGAHLLCQLVQTNEPVRAIYRSENTIENVREVFSLDGLNASLIAKIEWFKADITDVPSMIPAFLGVKKVYHCAAFISFNPKDYRAMRKVNIHGTAIIVNLSIDAKVDKICFVSSIASIGNSVNEGLLTEENQWNPQEDNSGYSITKFGAEMEVWRASQEGVDVVIVNPGIILGGGFWNSGSGKLFTKVFNGFKYYTEGITGFVGVTDVVKTMVQLTNSTIKNERFILVSENKSYKEVLFLIADALDKKRPHKKVYRWQMEFLWRISSFLSIITRKEPLLSKYAAKSANSTSLYTSKKIKETLSLKFQTIEEVVKDVSENYPTAVS